jgi:hypothetical protein
LPTGAGEVTIVAVDFLESSAGFHNRGGWAVSAKNLHARGVDASQDQRDNRASVHEVYALTVTVSNQGDRPIPESEIKFCESRVVALRASETGRLNFKPRIWLHFFAAPDFDTVLRH